MALITVEGIPDNISKGNLAALLKTVVFKDKVFDFWVQKYKGNMFKKADIKFKTVEDAEQAKQMLHGFDLSYNLNTYHLSCYQLQVTPDYLPGAPKSKSLEQLPKNNVFFNRERSRSPISNISNCDEIRKVDKKIELIRKQRILVEEEKKLLIEKKKLQILKNFKTTDIKALQLFESVNEVAELELVVSPKRGNRTIEKLPGYLRLNRVIISQMKTAIKKHITQENSYKLRKFINNTIKERLAVFLEGKTYVKLQSVLAQYRSSYPIDTDEDMLKELSKVIEQTDSHATANELQTQETTNDGQTESGIDIEAENKAKRKSEEPAELNEVVDMENDVDDWTYDEPVETPNIDLTQDSRLEDTNCTVAESVDLTDNNPVIIEDNDTHELIELIPEAPEINMNTDII